jgi:adenylate cyclase
MECFVAALHDQLAKGCDEMLRLSQQLQSMGEMPSLLELRNDFNKVQLAAIAFEKAVHALKKEGAFVTTPMLPAGVSVSADAADRKPNSNSAGAKKRAMQGLILIVDDNEGNRDVLSRRLLRDGCDVMLAESGRQALRMAARYDFDIVLLDIMMPEMDGYTVLTKLKEHPTLRHLRVIMITAVDEIESVVRCIELGADDYLLKPFNPTLLRARISALLERKRLREEEARNAAELESALAKVTSEQAKGKELLLNILPLSIAQELQENGVVEPMYFEDVTVAFADFVGFTLSTVELPAEDLVNALHGYFTAFDRIMVRYALEKLKTIGDCYMWAGGLPVRSPSHPVDMILTAFEMVRTVQELAHKGPVDWKVRIGVNTGPIIAGVVGTHKFAFDIWGDTVNFSSRMEASGAPQRINISANTFSRVKDFFQCEKRDKIVLKDGREVETYFVNGIALSFRTNKDQSPVKAFRQRYRTYFRKELPAFPEWLAEETAVTVEVSA